MPSTVTRPPDTIAAAIDTAGAGVWLGFVVCFSLICAGIELVKYYIMRTRVELLKEVKGLELQLLEIKEHLQHRPA